MQKPVPHLPVVFFLLVSGFIGYLILRVTRIPITHDEAGTILNFSTQSVWEIITFKDPVPNNHIFHTLLVKAFISIFGYEEWACRLPNLIGGLLYICFGFFTMSRISAPRPLWAWIGLIFLIGNPYVVEFFALARGYGLSIALMMVSIYLLVKGSKKDLYASLCIGGVAVYANLTLLNYFIPLFVLVLAMSILQRDNAVTKQLSILSAIFLLVLACIAIPVIKMIQTDQFQYWGTKGFYQDTFMPLLQSSIMGKKYFGSSTPVIFEILIILLVVITGLGTLYILIKSKKSALVRPEFQLGYLFFSSVIYNNIQYLVFKVPYLNARTALFFYPLFILAVFSMVVKIRLPTDWKVALTIPLLALAIWHIKTGYNLHSSYEWWFDGDNKKVMQAISDDSEVRKTGDKITLKCNWIFQPSLTYYTKIKYIGSIEPPPYSKTIDTSEIVDYYYITSDDKNGWFDQNYTILKSFAWDTRYLMKKTSN